MNSRTAPTVLSRWTSRLTRNHAIVFVVAIVAQFWILGLPFQFDDYAMLSDPLSIFARAYNGGELTSGEQPAFMMRFTLWLFWAIGRACSGDVLSPVPFHATALLLHGVTSLLVAKLVTRLAPAHLATTAGTLAGLAFAISSGGIQAVSWTAAQSDLLFPLFGLLAANAFFAARDHAGPHRTKRHVVAFLFTVLALWSKAPAFLIPPALFFLLWTKRPSTTQGRAFFPRQLRVETFWLALALITGFASRFLYLGSFQLRYQSTTVDLSTFTDMVPRALHVLGQALYPWNRHEVFCGDGPWFAELYLSNGTTSPAMIAGVLFGVIALLAFVLERRVRGALLTCLLLAFVCSLPSALISEFLPTNVLGRTTYFPLVFAWSSIALAIAALIHRVRPLGLLALALSSVAIVDTRNHVVKTETLASEYHAAAIDLIENTQIKYLTTDQVAPLVQIVVLPDNALGGIPVHGYRLEEAFMPPFYPAPGIDVRVFNTPAEALDAISTHSLGKRAIQIHGREWKIKPDDGIESDQLGKKWRELLSVRPWTPLRPSFLPDTVTWTLDSNSTNVHRWIAPDPVPAHAFSPLQFIARPGPAAKFEISLERVGSSHDFIVIPIQLGPSLESRKVAVQPFLDLLQLGGPPIKSVTCSKFLELLIPPQPLMTLPLLDQVSPAPGAKIPLADAPPSFQIQPPKEWALPAALRVELRQLLPRGPQAFFVDSLISPDSAPQQPLSQDLNSAHIDPNRAPSGQPQPGSFLWPQIRARLNKDIRRLPLYNGELDWRPTLMHPGGHPATQSPRHQAIFLPEPSFP
jgi:hypothetical protein